MARYKEVQLEIKVAAVVCESRPVVVNGPFHVINPLAILKMQAPHATLHMDPTQASAGNG